MNLCRLRKQKRNGQRQSTPLPDCSEYLNKKAVITHLSLPISHLYTRALIAAISPASILVNPKHLRPRSLINVANVLLLPVSILPIFSLTTNLFLRCCNTGRKNARQLPRLTYQIGQFRILNISCLANQPKPNASLRKFLHRNLKLVHEILCGFSLTCLGIVCSNAGCRTK